MELLLRSWNAFHGNADPPERDAFLEEVVRLASADQPDAILLQELPVWALPRLVGWSGMQAVADVGARPVLPPELGHRVTDLHHGLLRSAVTGQANAILVRRDFAVRDHARLVLNERRFRRSHARRLGLGSAGRLAWARERRVCQFVRVFPDEGVSLALANLHATVWKRDRRLAGAELERAAVFVDALAQPDEPLVLGGDFNLDATSPSLQRLTTEKWGFTRFGDVVDHFLVRGAELVSGTVWPKERRRVGGRVLSDHNPVEIRIGI